jgi:hypothetical protein
MHEPTDNESRVFDVETRYQTMARRPGGIPREQAIEEADLHVERMKPGFDEWLDSELGALAEAIGRAGMGAAKEEWLEAAELHSRTVRDVGTTMDAELLTFVANSLCEILDAIEAGSDWDADTLVCHLDALTLVRQPEYRGMGPDHVPELTHGLRRLVERISTAQAQA